MQLEVIQIPDLRLRQVAAPVETFDEELRVLVENMKETLRAEGGIGLAAPQVGVLKRIIVVCVHGQPDGLMVTFVNPEIIESIGTQVNVEGCLSVPGEHGEVERAMTVCIKAQNVRGGEKQWRVSAFEAACIQHELDHLNGVLFVDKLKKTS